jgi:protein-S-isoprenylcysteine O-methyltransferase Ste14
MDILAFFITLTAEALTTLAVVISIACPRQRIWPPSRQRAWGQYCMLILFGVSGAGVILLGILDWGSFTIPVWIRAAAGAPLWLVGNLLALWAVSALGAASTSGAAGVLIRRGPYGFSRNPQYLGFIVGLVGWALMSDAWLALIVSIVGTVPLVLVPFAEEPWLLERYGAAYAEYRRTVPRFVPWWK